MNFNIPAFVFASLALASALQIDKATTDYEHDQTIVAVIFWLLIVAFFRMLHDLTLEIESQGGIKPPPFQKM